jgi:hypothetical protein
LAGHFFELRVAGGTVVEDGETEDVLCSLGARDIDAGAAEDAGRYCQVNENSSGDRR